ncbi:AMP-binding protein [Nocardioides pocheonensis]|uniref:AMP-binding protein n=1 Tax=Nocardioides pocheonensis TaxID=661485 RepID=UPI001FEB26B7|nr:AMP-binding protein [Nocardioides pocheonensis]
MSSLWPVSGDAEGIRALLREWDAADDPKPLVIQTSGSTGRPKRVMLSRAAMRASALATQERLGGPGRWLLNLPPTYVAGVQVLYRSVVACTEPIPFQGSFSATRHLVHGRAFVSLVPTQLVRLLEDPDETAALEDFEAVLVGGGPLRLEVRERAEAAGVHVVQTYGMSETCGGCVYDGVPLPGVEVRIDDDEQVLVRGPMLFDGYEGEPERTVAAFRDGWFVTDDLGHWTPDGRLAIDSRVDDVVISGGVKVPGPAVAAALLGHPWVNEAEVVGVPDDEWGQRVVAVLTVSGPVALDELRDLVEPRSWAPRALVVVDELPLLPNGKVDRVTLEELAADA